MSVRPHMLFLPCLMGDARLWADQTRDLADLVIPEVPVYRHLESIAAMAAGVLAEAQAKFILCGLSLGGYTAFEIMRQAPERVQALALFNTSAQSDDEERTAQRLVLLKRLGETDIATISAMALDFLVHPSRLEDRELCSAIVAMAERVGPDNFVDQQRVIMGRPDSRPDLGRIRCPTLIVAGEEDAITPPEVHLDLARHIDNASIELIPDCGHMSAMERPAEVSALLRSWLQSAVLPTRVA